MSTPAQNPFATPQGTFNPEPVPQKVTSIFKFEMPTAVGVPEFTHRWEKGGYKLSDPVQVGTKGTRKVHTILNSTITNSINDIRGLEQSVNREVIRHIVRDPSVINVTSSMEEDDNVDAIYYNIKSLSFAQQTAEWAEALTEWINVVDYEITPLDDVPSMFYPYVKAYREAISGRGLTFNKELSRRLVTSAGEDGVPVEDFTTIVSNTNRVYADEKGNLVSLVLTTSSHPQRRIPGMVANAGIAVRAKRLLMRGSSAGWDKDTLTDNGWQNTVFGVISLPRSLTSNNKATCDIKAFSAGAMGELAKISLDVYNANNAGDTLFDNELLVPIDPVAAAIIQSTSRVEIKNLWDSFTQQGLWNEEIHTPMAFAHLMSIETV